MKKIILLFIILFPLLLCAQKLEQQLEKPGKLFVGTPFKLHVKITTALNDSIFAPQLDSLDVFFLMNNPQQTEIIEDKTKTTEVVLTFQAFDTGEYTFPPLEFMVKSAEKTEVLTTRDFVVIINSVLPDSATVIKDIAGPLSLKLGFWDYFIPAIILILLIMILKLAVRILKKKPAQENVPKITDTRPAWQIALEKLAALKNENLLDKGEFLEFYYRLSIILRFFIEKNYQINALEMTTSEIRSALKANNPKEKSEILQLLNESDKVKFARFIPDFQQAKELADWLEAYLKAFQLKNNGAEHV